MYVCTLVARGIHNALSVFFMQARPLEIREGVEPGIIVGGGEIEDGRARHAGDARRGMGMRPRDADAKTESAANGSDSGREGGAC